MAPHSSTLARKIPWVEEPGGLQSMGSRRVGHDWTTLLALFTFMHWRRKWQPAPLFLPGESQGRGSLVGFPSMGSHRVGHYWIDAAAAAAGKDTGVGCHFLLQGIFPTHGLSPGLLHWQVDSLPLCQDKEIPSYLTTSMIITSSLFFFSTS